MVVIGLFGSLNIEITARGEFLENLSGEKKVFPILLHIINFCRT